MTLPANSSRPGMSGTIPFARIPVAISTNDAVTLVVASSSTVQVAVSSSNTIPVTVVSSWMSRRRSNRSATWLRYSRISGCGA